ncbi:DNA replication/repair protein RecF [Roseivirga sp. BDSF3-8]|uniref:DNA replication/repair protein RecF n=1 Tax=Roseivirga sp. BDSF3-8 TaxID=3241598 RepID=UPI003531DEE6
MYLEKIELLNFKNYESLALDFDQGINCFTGPNGSGKTNLLDAIYYLSLTKSAFSSTDSSNIRHDSSYFMLRGVFTSDKKAVTIQCQIQSGQKKKVLHDKTPYEKISEHIGRFPAVLIAPDDTELVKGGSEGRRRFFDSLISQIDARYLDDLIRYNQVLKRRQELLKQFENRKYFDGELLDVYDRELVEGAIRLGARRRDFIEEFSPLFVRHYEELSDGKEKVALSYQTEVTGDDFEKKFRKSRDRDLMLQRTNKGIHKDDFTFLTDDHSLKKFGSQGQQKSFVIALKLAKFDVLTDKKGFKPLLLLDDIFDKLDDSRISHLVGMITARRFGQVFLTEARPERTKKVFEHISESPLFFDIKTLREERAGRENPYI